MITHLCQRETWLAAMGEGEYRADSLDQEGFIHCSRPEQIIQVANNYFTGIHDLLILWINPQKVVADICWEPADSEVFPHIYGPINLEAVEAVNEFTPDADGIFRIPPSI